ncbi:MAG: c-type cytochrome domain-containing protein, partial [Planctomycetota bacterium]
MMRISLICGLVLFGSVTSLAQEKAAINFTDHVLPIFREHCLACHNANDAEAGLAIDTYAGIMEGGGSGDAVMDGDPDSSKLYLVMTHAEEPVMPPDQDPLPKEQLDIIRQWIEGGLLETSGSKRRKRKGPSLSFSATDSSGKPEQIAMPETAWRVPVVSTTRHAASSAIATSPWAPLVAVGGQRQVALYHTETAELLGVLPYPEGIPQTLKFSRDGAYLLVAGGTHASKGTASLYDIRNGNRLLSVGDELDVVFGADINDNLSKIALGGPQRIVRIFDTSTGEILHELKKHTDWVYSVAYSPDGVLVATGDRSGGLHVWEAETGRLYLDLIGHKAAVRGISWRADSNVLVSASEDGTVKLWEMNSGNQLKSFNAHGGGATGVMMARDGRLVTCGKDRTVKLWDAAGKNIATMPAFPEPALEATITHDGKKIIGGDWSGQTIMWTIADTKQAVKLAADPPTLNQQQASWSTRVVELQKTLDAAKSNEAAVQKTLNDLAAKTKSFGDQKTQTIASQSKAQEELTSTEKQLAELNSQRASIAKMHEAATTSASDMAMKLKAMNTLLNAEKAKVGAATTQRDQSSNEMAKSADELSKLKQQHAKMKSDAVAPLAKIAERILDLQANQRVSSEAETEAETKRSSAEQQVNQLNQQVSDLDAEIKKVTESIAQATNDDEKKSLAEKQTSLQNKKPQLIARRMESENQIKRWTASRDESRNRVAEFAKQLVQLEQEEKAA